MNDFSIVTKFLFTIACAVVTLVATHSIGHLTYKMAVAAVEAQQHDQMSYGKFSRQLWSRAGKR